MAVNSIGYGITRSIGLFIVGTFRTIVRWVVGRKPVLGREVFPGAAAFEERWQAIREEALRVMNAGKDIELRPFVQEQAAMVAGAKWRTYVLMLYGHEYAEHMDACPVTAGLIASDPAVASAMFSILPPGSTLLPHSGAYNGVVRYHLGLIVPDDRERCRLVLDGMPLYWGEGEGLLFDDTFRHDVINHTGRHRVVLFLDVLRPLPFPLDAMNMLLFRAIGSSPFVKRALEMAARTEGVRFRRKTGLKAAAQ